MAQPKWPPTTPDSLAPANILDDGTIEIRAGAGMQQRSFIAYKNALRHYSLYFKAQLSGFWPEPNVGVLNFPDVDAEIMQRILLFVTARRYLRPESVEDQYSTLSKVWILADFLGIPLLCNHVINELRDAAVDCWMAPVIQISYIYEHTEAGSNLRRAAVFYTCHVLGANVVHLADLGDWPAEAVRDMLTERRGRVDRGERVSCTKSWLLSRYVCQFHFHDAEDCPEEPGHDERLLALAESERGSRQA